MDKAISSYLADLKAAGRSPATLESYEQTLRVFSRYLTSRRVRRVRRIRADDVRGYLLALRERGMKSSTVRERAIILTCFFNWLVRQGALRVSPMLQVTRPKGTPPGRRTLAKEEVVAMLALAEETRKARRNVAILYLLLDCGLRASELLSIRASDYTQVTSTLIIHGKGDKWRVVRMGERCKAAFEAYLAERDGGGWGLGRKGLQALVGRLGRQIGVHTFPHQLRHCFAAYFLDNGGGVDELRILLGHASLMTTLLYTQGGQEARALRSHALHSPADHLPLAPNL